MVAHELFQNETEKLERRRRDLISKIMLLWRENARNYRILPIRYQFLLKEKRLANLHLHGSSVSYNLRTIKADVLCEYPEIPFFRILHEEVALAWLEDMCLFELEDELDMLQFNLTANCAYNALRSWVTDATYLFNQRNKESIANTSSRKKVKLVSGPGFA